MKNEITNIRGREKITREFYINLRDSCGIDFVVYDRRKYKIVFEGQGGYIHSNCWKKILKILRIKGKLLLGFIFDSK